MSVQMVGLLVGGSVSVLALLVFMVIALVALLRSPADRQCGVLQELTKMLLSLAAVVRGRHDEPGSDGPRTEDRSWQGEEV